MDRRLTPPEKSFEIRTISNGVTALLQGADEKDKRDTELLFGEAVRVFERKNSFAYVQAERDHYVGWITETALAPQPVMPNHRVISMRTHAYSTSDLKSPETMTLPQGARLRVTDNEGDWRRVQHAGWVHARHIAPIGENFAPDPAAVALRYEGTPYLWGGRTSLGLDCTGLTQTAFDACSALIPRDSDMQFEWTGVDIPDWKEAGALQRNDLVFWKGHVGIMLDETTLCHANAWHMAVAIEPLGGAVERIKNYYAEPIGARRIDWKSLQGQTPDWKVRQTV